MNETFHVLSNTCDPVVYHADSRALIRVSAEVARIMRSGSGPAYHSLCSRLEQMAGNTGGNESPVAPSRFKVVLMISQACNMECEYCFQGGSGGLDRHMSPATVARAIHFFCSHYPPSKLVFFMFGGEPCLNWPAIEAAVEATTALYPDPDTRPGLAIQTNATLLEPVHARFLHRNRFAVTVSVDGPAAIHDQLRRLNRGASYDRVMRGIGHLRASGVRFTAEATVTARHHRSGISVQAVLDHLLDLGADSAHLMPVITDISGLRLDGDTLEDVTGQFAASATYSVGTAIEGRPRRLQYASYIVDNLLGPPRLHICHAGTGTVTVMPGGEIFPCYYLLRPELNMGTVYDQQPGPDYQRVHTRLSGVTKADLAACRTCWARWLCNSCYGASGGTIAAPEPGMCKIQRAMIDSVLSRLTGADAIGRCLPALFG